VVAVFVFVSAEGVVVGVSVAEVAEVAVEEVEESVVMAEVEVAESGVAGVEVEVEVSVIRVWEDIEVLEVED